MSASDVTDDDLKAAEDAYYAVTGEWPDREGLRMALESDRAYIAGKGNGGES